MTSIDNTMVTVEQPTNLQKRKHDEVVHGGGQSTWKCDECSHRNYASASECFKCKTSQEVQLKRKKENPNSWTCTTCRNNNWPQRTVCNRCKAPKPGYESQLQNYSNDWTCLNCDNINRAFRMECNKCKMNKVEAVNPMTGQYRTNQDWLCMSCGNSNYPYRIACNKCKLPKHEAMTASRTFSKDKPENWLCFNCDNVNLPFRNECNKCKIEKEEGINPDTAFKRTNLDWKCTVCENVNFYYRVFCNKCQLPKSEIGEEVHQAAHNSDGYNSQTYPDQYANNDSSTFQSAPAPAAPHGVSSVPLPHELTGVPTEPIEMAAVQMYRQQQAASYVTTPPAQPSNYTVQHDVVNNRSENWTCYNCDNLNFPLRTQCNKCKMAKAEAVAPETRAGRAASGDRQWSCPPCGNSNYHYRLECNKCKAERPPRTVPYNNFDNSSSYNSSSNYPSNYNQNSSYPSNSNSSEPTCNWICNECENVNWPKRTKCNKCGVAKGSQNPNWVCAPCSHVNYSFVVECGNCKASKDA